MSMYRIEEFPDVWADACLRDSEGDLMFLSAYGRDGALMQMLAAFELSSSERGTDHIHLVGKDASPPSSSNAICHATTSVCWSWMRGTSTRTRVLRKARPWGCLPASVARRCC